MSKARVISFAAIDFETADYQRDSACSIGIVVVRGSRVVNRIHHFIRPPRARFVPMFIALHGITWAKVRKEKTFAELWPELEPILLGVDFVAAHNAAFDLSVLNACCATADAPKPLLPACCTVRVARQLWDLPRHKLPDVCQHLGIPLPNHHDALADAEACARIVQHALKAGWAPS